MSHAILPFLREHHHRPDDIVNTIACFCVVKWFSWRHLMKMSPKHALVYAARTGNLDLLMLAYFHGADLTEIKTPDYNLLTPVVERGYVHILAQLLEWKYFDTMQWNYSVLGFRGLLCAAARCNQVDMIDFLLSRQDDMIRRKSATGLLLDTDVFPSDTVYAAMLQAVTQGQLLSIQRLMTYTTHEHVRSQCNRAARSAAFGWYDYPRMADGRWHDHLMFVAAQYGHLHVLTYFYDVFAMYDMHDVFETCKHDILGFASRHGHIDIVKFLLDNGADPSQHAEYAFLRACYYNHRDVVELLLASYTPSPAIVSKAIENVIGECHCDMYERLMMLPNDGLDDATLVYNTLLANTSSGLKVFQMMQRLHAHGVNILTDVQRDGSIDRDDMMKSTTSALALAARRGHMLVVQMLVGMDVTQEMKDDALAWAVIHKYHKMMSYLIKHGANVKAKNNRALRVAEEVENRHAVLRLTKLCK